jgi:hypothetical protein
MLKSYVTFLLIASTLSFNTIYAQVEDNPKFGDDNPSGVAAPNRRDDNPKGDDNPKVGSRPFNSTNTTTSPTSDSIQITFPNYIYLTSFFYLFL